MEINDLHPIEKVKPEISGGTGPVSYHTNVGNIIVAHDRDINELIGLINALVAEVNDQHDRISHLEQLIGGNNGTK